jgi:hypothetical protein
VLYRVLLSFNRDFLANMCPQAQCRVFTTTYNPEGLRTGNKVLRQRLRGAALALYYPRSVPVVRDIMKAFAPDLETWDEQEDDRQEHLAGSVAHLPFEEANVQRRR